MVATSIPRLTRQLVRPAISSLNQAATRGLPLALCPACCSPSTSTLLEAGAAAGYRISWQPQQQQQLRFASKKKHSKGKKSSKAANHEEDAEDEIEVEDHPVPVFAKGKKAKAAQVTPEDAIEAFDLDKLEKSMDDAVERFQVDSRAVIGRVERLSPGMYSSATLSVTLY